MISALRASGPSLDRFPLDDVDYRLAETEFEKEEIYRLRYRAYLHEGAIEPRCGQKAEGPLRRPAEFVDFRGVYRRQAAQFDPYQCRSVP